MRIIGIDPRSRVAGYGVIEVSRGKFKYVSSGVVKLSLKGDFTARLPQIYESFYNIFQQYSLNHLAIESLIHVKNVLSLAKLAQTKGAMLAATGKFELDVFEYSPNKVKSTVSGFGHADKEMVTRSIEVLIGQKVNFATHDESDAMAIALTHGLTAMGKAHKSSSSQLFSRKRTSIAASINPDKLKNNL